MFFEKLEIGQQERIEMMSAMATEIVKEHFDPIIGAAQNDYMIAKFQTVSAISEQLAKGYQYYFVKDEAGVIGFLAFYPKDSCLYLSKFYLYKDKRGKGISKQMLQFVIDKAKECGLSSIELNVNRNNYVTKVYEKLGFTIIREEKNDIGAGYFMDDYVYQYKVMSM